MPDMEQLLRRINDEDGFIRHNGIRAAVLEKGFCECRAEVAPEGMNPHGIAHGGLLFAMCDTAAGIAATTLGWKVVTRSSNMHFLRPARPGTVTARGRVVQAGTHTALCRAEVLDEKGELLAEATFDMYRIDP